MKQAITITANSQVSCASMGGSDKIFIEMARVWKAEGHPLSIIGCREAGEMCRRAGLEDSFKQISGFDVERIGLFPAYFFRALSAVFYPRMVKEGIVYSSSDFYPDLFLALRQKMLEPQLKWVAGIFLIAQSPLRVKAARNIRGVLYWLSQSIAISLMRWKADRVIVLCAEDRDFLAGRGIAADRITVISGGINRRAIDGVPVVKEGYEGCFVGRFHAQKGIPELIRIWRKVVDKFPQAKLALIGWGTKQQVKSINALVKKEGLTDNISLLGYLDERDKYAVIKSSKVFLFPSSYESWGIVIAEAFGCGCPVVAFDIGATRKFNQGIIRVSLGDTAAFADKVFMLLTQEQVRLRLAKEAGNSAGQFSWEDSARVFIAGLA